jgi:hypothetical protein
MKNADFSVRRLIVTANVHSTLIFVTLMMEAIILPKRWFLQEPHDVTSQKTAFLKKGGCNYSLSLSFAHYNSMTKYRSGWNKSSVPETLLIAFLK